MDKIIQRVRVRGEKKKSGLLQQGDSIHMECRISPINDSKLTVNWLKDDKPLAEASRFKPSYEFGFVTLDILYALPEDSGIYDCVVMNDKGEASTRTHVTVKISKFSFFVFKSF